jgi:acetylglutamate kinase
VIYLTDIAGLLRDVADPGSLITATDTTEIAQLIETGVLSGGMIPKIEACLDALAAGVPSAHLLDGRVPHVVLLELFTRAGVGTMITPPTEEHS